MNDPTSLVLVNQISISATTDLTQITSLVIVENYTPAELDYRNLVSLQSLRMFDGNMTTPVQDAISTLAKTQKVLRYLEIPRWGPSIKASAFELSDVDKHLSIQQLVGFEDVTHVGSKAFYYYSGLTSLSLPELITIDSHAFYCAGLRLVSLPKVTTAATYAFYGVGGLTSLSLPKLTCASNWVFAHCRGLVSLSLPLVTTVKPCVVDKKRCCKTKANSGFAGKRYLNYSCFSLTKNEKRHDQYPTKAVS